MRPVATRPSSSSASSATSRTASSGVTRLRGDAAGGDLGPRLAQLAHEADDEADLGGVALAAGLHQAALAVDVDGLEALGDRALVHVQGGEELVDDRLAAVQTVVSVDDGALGERGFGLTQEAAGPVVQHHDELLRRRGEHCALPVRLRAGVGVQDKASSGDIGSLRVIGCGPAGLRAAQLFDEDTPSLASSSLPCDFVLLSASSMFVNMVCSWFCFS